MIPTASFSRIPVALLFFTRSLPAKSTKCSCDRTSLLHGAGVAVVVDGDLGAVQPCVCDAPFVRCTGTAIVRVCAIYSGTVKSTCETRKYNLNQRTYSANLSDLWRLQLSSTRTSRCLQQSYMSNHVTRGRQR